MTGPSWMFAQKITKIAYWHIQTIMRITSTGYKVITLANCGILVSMEICPCCQKKLMHFLQKVPQHRLAIQIINAMATHVHCRIMPGQHRTNWGALSQQVNGAWAGAQHFNNMCAARTLPMGGALCAHSPHNTTQQSGAALQQHGAAPLPVASTHSARASPHGSHKAATTPVASPEQKIELLTVCQI